MMPGAVSEDQTSVKSEDSITARAKFLCSYGGRIMPRPHDNQLRYVGGETRILSVPRAAVFGELMAKLKKLCMFENALLKYQLPDEDLDALVSVISDEDLENMMEEYDRVEDRDSNSRLRLFLFPVLKQDAGAESEHKFVDAVNGVYRKTAVETQTSSSAPVLEEQQPRRNFVLIQHPVPTQLPPQVCAATPGLVPQVVYQQPVAPVQSPQVLPPLPVAPSVQVPMNNLVAAPHHQLLHTKLLAAPTPGRGASPANGVPQVLAARTVLPQTAFVAPAAAPRPVAPASTYIPLVDVSRGVLPKGMALRQFSVEDDRSESPSSQSSLVNEDRRDSGEMVDWGDARRVIDANEFEKLRIERAQESNMILQHLQEAKMVRGNAVLGGQTKVDSEMVPQMAVQVFVPGKAVHEQGDGFGVPRGMVFAPVLQTGDATTAPPQQFQRQFSDRSEPQFVPPENFLPRCIAGQDVLVQLDDRFPSPLPPRPLNGVRPQQEHLADPSPQLLPKPIKGVPQVVALNPYKAP